MTAMADRLLSEVKRMHQLRQDINEMTPEEADELIRGLGLCRARCTTAAARPVMVLAVSRRPRRRQIALDVDGGAYRGARWDKAHSLHRPNHDRLSRCQRRGQKRYIRDLRRRSTAAWGGVAATAGMAERRNVRVLLGRGAGIVARTGSGNSGHRRNRAHALSAKRIRYHDARLAARRSATRSHRHHTAHHALHEKTGGDGRRSDHDRLNL